MNNSGDKNPTIFDCAVIGDWHLAFCTAIGLTAIGKKVLLVNPSGQQNPWKQFPRCPVTEPDLDRLQEEALKKGDLDYSNDLSGKDWNAENIWLAVDTPVDANDQADVTPLEQIAQAVSPKAHTLKTFAISSQVPLGFCSSLENRFKLPVCYVPENLRLGKGLETFTRSDRTVIGSSNQGRSEYLKTWLAKFQTEFLLCNLETAEMIKHATNIFLATSISFANELARVGESLGVDCDLLAKGLKMDKRIGKAAYVAPGLGFAGGTLPRDLRILQNLGRKYSKPTKLVDAVLDVNAATTDAVYDSILPYLKNTSSKILILGYTYKADTDTLRRSLSVDLAQKLSGQKFEVFGYDPTMNGKDISAIAPYLKHLDTAAQLESLKPDVVVVMTARPTFKELPLKKFGQSHHLFIFDSVGLLNPIDVVGPGIAYKKLWQKEISA